MRIGIKKYLFKKEGLPLEFEILDLSKTFTDKFRMMTEAHRAQFYHILWLEKSSGIHQIDFQSVELKDNSIVFIPSDSVNIYDKLGIYNGKAILFTDDFFCKNKNDKLFLQNSILFSDLYKKEVLTIDMKTGILPTYFAAMETEFNRLYDKSQYYILHNLLHVFLLQAEREMRNQGFQEIEASPRMDIILEFKALLSESFKENKSVKDYAALMNITEKQLQTACNKVLNKTPKTIIDERIILEAKRLLVHSTISIKELAYELGYEEPTNFVKYFRKHTNKTPLEFRQEYQQ